MDETHYAALTGDLVASRKAPPADRSQIQKQCLRLVDEFNRDLGSDLARPVVLTAGDEIQALLRRPSRAVELLQRVKDFLYDSTASGQEIVFGVGWGTLSTGLLTEATGVEQLDGSCFHRARQALERAKKAKTWAVFEGFGAIEDETLTSFFELMGAIRAGWTSTQSWHTVELRDTGKRIEVAKRRGVSPSVITESLQLAHFDAVLRGEETARRILERFDPAREAEAEGGR